MLVIIKMINESLVAYLILIVVFVFVWWKEKKDWECSNIDDPYEKCDGNGMPFRNSFPSETDTLTELSNKIDIASGAEVRSIKWRRSFIYATIISVTIFILIFQLSKNQYSDWKRFLNWRILYLMILVSFCILYFQFNYYSYHRFSIAEENTKKATKIMQKNYFPTN